MSTERKIDPGASPWRFPVYSREQLLDNANGLWGHDMPRLPTPPMLMIDRITHVTEFDSGNGGRIIGELDLKPAPWFFGCHFIGDPVMPGCLQFDAVLQLAGFYTGHQGARGKGRAIGSGETSFLKEITPASNIVRFTVVVKRLLLGRKKSIVVADGSVDADGSVVATVKDLKVVILP